jgi:hypothetical protein
MQYPDSALEVQKVYTVLPKIERWEKKTYLWSEVVLSLGFFSHAPDGSPKSEIAFATLLQ